MGYSPLGLLRALEIKSMSPIDGGGILGSFNQSHAASRLAQTEKSCGQNALEGGSREARRRFELAREEVLQTETLHGGRVDPDEHHEEPRGGPKRKPPRKQFKGSPESDNYVSETSPDGKEVDDDQRGHLIDIRA